MGSAPLILLLSGFIASAVITWIAGINLTKTTDSLDTRFKIGDALGGLILLGITGSLPEIAVVTSAAIHGHIPVIIGNLIGGLSIQTLLLVFFDFANKGKRPLSYLAGSITLFFETMFAVLIAFLVLIGTFVPAEKSILNFNPLTILIVIAWVSGLFLINKIREVARFNKVAPDASPGRKQQERRHVENYTFYAKKSTIHILLIFFFAAAATFAAGFLLEETGTAIASVFGIGSGIFAATVLALVTSLPEISTGLESVIIGDNQLAISDIFGSNAFMLTIFFLADLLAGGPVLSNAGRQGIIFAALGIGMMSVYGVTFLVKLKSRYFRLGLDSILVLILYLVGIFALQRIM
jgi:cation:H+ antiporter